MKCHSDKSWRANVCRTCPFVQLQNVSIRMKGIAMETVLISIFEKFQYQLYL